MVEGLGVSGLGAAQMGFDLAPHLLNGIEVRRVGGKEPRIGGMKRYGAMSQVLRNKTGRFDDRVALVSADLWNHHLASQASNPA